MAVNSDIDLESHNASHPVAYIIAFALFIIYCVGLWKVFEKAGQKGWKAFIPIYNLIILMDIIEKSRWWAILFFIPIINIIIHVICMFSLADHFSKSTCFKLGLIFLPFVFLMILGFDESKYTKQSNEINNTLNKV